MVNCFYEQFTTCEDSSVHLNTRVKAHSYWEIKHFLWGGRVGSNVLAHGSMLE